MGTGMIILIVLAVMTVALIAIYNGLIRARNHVQEAWADIDVQLKRRYDLIPNLVESVKGYAAHESGVFTQVTEARSKAMSARSASEHAASEAALTRVLGNIMAVAENYPQLKASENFKGLQDELSDTENKIQAARRFYNSQVLAFNNKLEVFPTNVIGGWLHFTKQEFFEAADAKEREAVNVKF
jgi:LemA protein